MEEFKGNSNASKHEITPITSNVKVADEKKRRFFSSDGRTVAGQVLDNVLLPGVQKLFSDTFKSAIDWLIFGSKGNPKPGISQVSYTNYYDRNRTPLPTVPSSAYAKPTVYAFSEVTFNERGDAEVVLQTMRDAIQQYGMVSVADFYDMISRNHSFTDCKYGWRDLSTAQVERCIDGYRINFPKISPIE